MYDYEAKYDADEFGMEMGPNSRFYKTYVDESDVYDTDKMEGYRDVLDVLLVFVSLTFIV